MNSKEILSIRCLIFLYNLKIQCLKATEAVGKEGESYLRNTDTEYKILNDIASRLGENTQATGKIKLFTELDTCDSCSKVIAEFTTKYKNIELEVIHNNGNRIIP